MKKGQTRKVKLKGEYACDFETTSEKQYKLEGETRVYLFKMVSLKNDYEKRGVKISDFIEELKNNEDIKKVYFHNLSFDGSFIIDYLLKQGYKFIKQDDNFFTEQKQFKAIIDDFSSIYSITIHFNNDKVVVLGCSYKLIGLPIKDMGKMVGVEKLDETHDYDEIKNYNSIDELTEEEKKYISNDVEIMRLGIISCYEMGIRGLTKASACFNIWKGMSYMTFKNVVCQEETERINNIVRTSYRGGITMVNKLYQGKIIENCRDYDVNSLYPSVMYNDMPKGLGEIYHNESKIPHNKTMRLYTIHINHAKIMKGYIPFIPTTKGFAFKDSYSYPYELDNINITLWWDEFILFKTYYEIEYTLINIVAWLPIKNLFKSYLDKFRKMKEEAPNPSPQRQFAKIAMNSVYGKFAQNKVRISKEPFITKEGVSFTPYETKGKSYDMKIASKITSDARCVLIRALQKDPKRFIYCDTDSIYIKGDYDYDIPQDDKELGKWKYEYSYYKFKCLKAKCYIATIKGGKDDGKIHSAVAGLPKEIQETMLNFNNFQNELQLEDVKKQHKRVNGGIIITKAPYSIKIKNDEIEYYTKIQEAFTDGNY